MWVLMLFPKKVLQIPNRGETFQSRCNSRKKPINMAMKRMKSMMKKAAAPKASMMKRMRKSMKKH